MAVLTRRTAWRRWEWWFPAAALGAEALQQGLLGGIEPVSFLLAGVPPLAAASRGPRTTALLALVCLAFQLAFSALRPGHLVEEHHLSLYLATALIGAASTWLARQRQRAQQRVRRADAVAEAMQRTLLHPVPPLVGHLRAAGFHAAGAGGAPVGGDLYDVCETPFGVRAIIGDVRGKGIGAVRTTAAVLGAFRVSAHEWPDLALLAQRLELGLARSRRGLDADPELFVTALLLEFPAGSDEVRLVDRGHPRPIVLGPGGVRPLETATAPPLGLGWLLPDRAATAVTHRLRPGEVLVAHTDGISEARNADGTFYPVLDRLAARFGGGGHDPAEVAGFLGDDTARWSRSRDDDQAVLAFKPAVLALGC
ncbi:PP2C family protein-serine/threonine phosphatase [Kitasatospora cineracea]|uniref:Serine phosphatase RsbU (Regulator of sigma subunit) n=1 Tax=Kitasatospora cineracea TaxID=88074 RepID=A0A8G1ULU4_9ACTN|nr:PP2C family protein-serine/threonine phosphatase [Kitasatospora cineracea]ROR46421.1 serine phosphatase RsbU (regulator of sigma subunit) [Kitasatospora cineracea]